jgi:DNA-binding CsgD family transcriptional regulator/tetratricopeptide (TPR) repeat protein
MIKPVYFEAIYFLKDKYLTLREIDVIACFTSGKSVKVLSHFLGIGQKTFDTHWNNIKNKLDFSSKEHLIRYIEENGMRSSFYNHYLFLKMEHLFRQACVPSSNSPSYEMTCFKRERKDKLYVELLKRHLEYVGARVTSNFIESDNENSKIYLTLKDEKGKILSLSLDQSPQQDALSQEVMNICHDEHNFSFICKVIKFFDDNDTECLVNEECLLEITKIQAEFEEKSQTIEPNFKVGGGFKHSQKTPVILIFLSFIILFLYFFLDQDSGKKHIHLPFHDKLIERKHILNDIKNKMGSKNNINICVIVGMAGSGKTTLSKQYIYQKKHSVSFEINAHSPEALEHSFFDMAYQLVENNQQKEALDFIKYNNDRHLKIEQVLDFISKILRKNPGWILLFDNVRDFEDIRPHLPKDESLWGKGEIIITTHNKNIREHFDDKQILKLGPLDEKEKHQLVSKTCGIKGNNKDILELTHSVPPFPLDIRLVCSHFKQNKKNPQNIASENRNDTFLKKRTDILTKSFTHIMEEGGKDAFILLGVCDFKNIPKNFLYLFFPKKTIDDLVINLEKYSLLTDNDADILSIHPFVQKEIIPYFLNQEEKEIFIKCINSVVKKIMHMIKNDGHLHASLFEQMTPHILAMMNALQSMKILEFEGELHYILAYCHYFGTRYLCDAKNHFEHLLSLDVPFLSLQDKKSITYILSVLYNDMGFDKMAIEKVDEGLKLCEKNGEKVKLLCQKGCILGFSDHFKDADECFNHALNLLEGVQENNDLFNLKSIIYQEKAWLYATHFLRKDGGREALHLMEKAFSCFPETPQNSVPQSLCYYYTTLGSIYCKLGQYDKALIDGFDKANHIIKNSLNGKKHHISQLFIDEGIGECLLRKGFIEKANTILKKVVARAHKLRGKSFSALFMPKVFLMESYLRLGDLDSAENELLHLLKYDVSGASNAFLFADCLMHFNAAVLYAKKNDFVKSHTFFSIFFKKINVFFEKVYGGGTQEQQDLCILPKDDIKNREDYFLFEKQASDALKTIYPNINLSHTW